MDADTTQGRFLIRAKFMDSNGASLGYSDITAMYPGAISSWTRVGGRVTAPANSVSMQVQYLLYQSSGWVNIDDVEVTIVAPNAATEVTKYYYFGGQRVAMRKNGVLTYLHGDHLGSTVLETNITGTMTSDEKYLAYGKQRDSGKVTTDHRFTGQKEDASGLQYFNARFYDPVIGMFVSPDTIVPQPADSFSYNRYLYSRANPLRFSDPTGHFSNDEIMKHFGCSEWACIETQFQYGGTLSGLWGWLHVLQEAVNGDSIVVNNSSALVYGTFSMNSNGQIEIMYGGAQSPGMLGIASGTTMPSANFAYLGISAVYGGASGYTLYSGSHNPYSSGGALPKTATNPYAKHSYVSIDGVGLGIIALKSGQQYGPILAENASACQQFAALCSGVGKAWATVGYGTGFLVDFFLPYASEDLYTPMQNFAVERTADAIRSTGSTGEKIAPHVGPAVDLIQLAIDSFCYGTGCPR